VGAGQIIQIYQLRKYSIKNEEIVGISSGEKNNNKTIDWNDLSKEQQMAFTQGGKIALLHWMIDGIEPAQDKFYDKKEINKLKEQIFRGETSSYPETDTFLYKCLEKHPIKGKTIAVIGSVNPWYEKQSDSI